MAPRKKIYLEKRVEKGIPGRGIACTKAPSTEGIWVQIFLSTSSDLESQCEMLLF